MGFFLSYVFVSLLDRTVEILTGKRGVERGEWDRQRTSNQECADQLLCMSCAKAIGADALLVVLAKCLLCY